MARVVQRSCSRHGRGGFAEREDHVVVLSDASCSRVHRQDHGTAGTNRQVSPRFGGRAALSRRDDPEAAILAEKLRFWRPREELQAAVRLRSGSRGGGAVRAQPPARGGQCGRSPPLRPAAGPVRSPVAIVRFGDAS